jgi:3-oxoacyl-[acyl-carrier protein] reductase
MDLGLAGQRMLVTGGSRGIGRAIVAAALAEGAAVATCARDEAVLAATAEQLRGGAPGATLIADPVDVTDGPAFEAWIESAIDRLGGLDVLVLNASIQPVGDDDATWELTVAADLLQVARAVRVARSALAASGSGSVVLTSSTTALSQSTPQIQHAYGSVKAAVLSYGAKLAALLGPEGIRVNSVIPGPIEFPGGSWDRMRQGMPQVVEAVERMSVLGRLGHAEEVAAAVLFLAGAPSSYITGASLRIDGGVTKTVDF